MVLLNNTNKGVITMDQSNFNTIEGSRKLGHHLSMCQAILGQIQLSLKYKHLRHIQFHHIFMPQKLMLWDNLPIALELGQFIAILPICAPICGMAFNFFNALRTASLYSRLGFRA